MTKSITETDRLEIAAGEASGITLKNLGMTFDTKSGTERVFEGIDLRIEAGSFVTLLGRSGSGKSTMVNIVSGVLEATEGRVIYGEDGDIDDVTLGHVFQSPRLLPWKTCVENIGFVHENNPEYTRDDAEEYLDLVGLAEHYDKYPTQISGGQQQRVGIARALSIDPEILLMDEPFSALDEITAEELRDLLIQIWQQLNKTVFFITHDITEAVQLSDRILMLGNGEIYGDFEVPLDRPRKPDDPEFIRFRQRVLEHFHSIKEQS